VLVYFDIELAPVVELKRIDAAKAIFREAFAATIESKVASYIPVDSIAS
jgi:hypothetical protein